ncbi:Protein Cep78 like protein [Dufourea novaeangliae]|uniref:Protein Cep78 like protein n=1 Tax=Dufourea novaeangliae TaxID=178035 RepID=A0A154NZ60_DUFNO|nr:Protein Cep78 like protein [Dufourea novaeangliae]
MYSRSLCRRIRERVNTEEKLEKLWRCGKDRAWPILYTNYLLRCLVDAVAVCARDSSRITSITIDGIPLSSKYLNILYSGLRDNEKLTHLSLTRCRIGDVGCNALLECLANVPNVCVLNLSGCRLTRRSAASLSLFLKRRRADLMQNVWAESPVGSHRENSVKKVQGLHTLILNQNPKFGDNGVRQLVCTLKVDCLLRSLSLKRCGITKQGAEYIICVLQSNHVLTKIDLTRNRIPINVLQVILKLLRRNKDTTEGKPAKKRYFVNWITTNNIRKPVTKIDKRTIDRSRRLHRNILKKCTLKRFPRIHGRPNELKEKKKRCSLKKKRLRELQRQMLDIISCNDKLKEELTSNKALLDAQVQERSRTENEMQRVSVQLNDLRSKVIMVNCLRSKLHNDNQVLQKDLRHFFEKFEKLLTMKQTEVEKLDGQDDSSELESLLFRQKGYTVTNYLEKQSYYPPTREINITTLVES